MTFQEALNLTLTTGNITGRKSHHFDKGGYHCTAWSEWIRIRLDDSHFDFDALVIFETNNFDEEQFYWTTEWHENNLSKADILASDWIEMEV